MSVVGSVQVAVFRSVHGVSSRVGDPLGPVDIDPDDVRDEACSVTAPPRLCDLRAPRDVDPIDPPDLPDTGLLSSLANLLLLAVVVALVVGLAWLSFRLVSGARRSPSGVPDDDEDDLDETIDGVVGARVVDHDMPPREWRRLADAHAAQGEYRDAVRCRYRALVGDLARAGNVDEIAGRTSGEERAQVADTVARLVDVGADGDATERLEQVTTSFDRAAGTFDAAWFDDEPVTAGDHDRFVAAERIVLDESVSVGNNRRTRAGSVR